MKMKKMELKRGLLLLAVLLALCTISGVVIYKKNSEKLDYLRKLSSEEYISQALNRLENDSVMTVGILNNGSITIKSYNKDGEILIPPEIDYEIGSITKTITGGILYDLIKNGEIGLDDSIDEYLELGQGNYPAIKDLLTHTAGYRSIYRKNILNIFNPMSNFHQKDAQDVILKNNAFSGADFEYSNFGYAVLGEIIEKTTGKQYPDIVEEYLKKEYGMEQTEIWNGNSKYHNENMFSWKNSDFYKPAGAAISNIDDMMIYLQKSIAGYESEQGRFQVLKNVVTKFEQIRGFGVTFDAVSYGWLVDTEKSILAHPGELPTSTAFIGFNYEEKVGTVVLINQAASPEVSSKLLGAKILNELNKD